MKLLPGDKISYDIYYLEMDSPPEFEWPVPPSDHISVISSSKPPSRYFFDLYAAVGADYEWTDKYDLPKSEIDEFLTDSSVKLFTLLKDGWTAGFFILDSRREGICELAYFGLVPEVIGFGYGKYLLKFAVKKSWAAEGVRVLTVNTNSLDHPNALPLYQRVGFKLTKTRNGIRTLSKSRNVDSNQNSRIG